MKTISNTPAAGPLQPQASEAHRPGPAAGRDLAGAEKAFAAALLGHPVQSESAPRHLGTKPQTELLPDHPTHESRQTPMPRSADVLYAKDEVVMPALQAARSHPLMPALPHGAMPSLKPATPQSEPSNSAPPPTPLPPAPNPRADAIAPPPHTPAHPATHAEPTARNAESKRPGEKTDPTANPALAPGDLLLRSLHGMPEPEIVAPAPAPAGDSRVSEIAEKVASRILVADRSTGAPEVRITLHESFLNGAEVRIRRDEGQVIVEFMLPNVDSQRFLHERRDDLQNVLKERLGDEVRVEIHAQDPERGNPDGRSRQRRSIRDEWYGEE
ncbi:MAG: type III secretion HpaP family protein [Gammaproteobacteria bacterium]